MQARVSLVVPEMVAELEQLIDDLTAKRALRPVFLVPGSIATKAAIDRARTVVRWAERRAVQARVADYAVNDTSLHYLNRQSDLHFVLATHAAEEVGESASHD